MTIEERKKYVEENRDIYNAGQKKYKQSDKGLITQNKYYHSDAKRAESKRWREAHVDQCKVNRKLQWAVLSGEIMRQPCIVCDNPKSHGHHEDYSKPFDVIWLCVTHHNLYHKGLIKLPLANNAVKAKEGEQPKLRFFDVELLKT